MAAAADAQAGGNYQLPGESTHAMRIEDEQRMSVVRLCITLKKKEDKQGHDDCSKKKQEDATKHRTGHGTGFIVVNTANKLVIMTCGHSFKNWLEKTKVAVTFHDRRQADAELVWVETTKEVALLLIDTSSEPELSAYPAVDFSYNDVRVGDVVVTLGHPYSGLHQCDPWNNFGSVTKEADLIANAWGDILQMFSADFGSGPGASGSPVFGEDGRVVGICISGLQDTSFALSVRWIRDTLKQDMGEVKARNLENLTIREMIELCYVHVPPPGHASAGSSSGGSDAQSSAAGGGEGSSGMPTT